MLANLVADSLLAAIVLVRKKNCSNDLTPMVYFETNIMFHLRFKRYSTWPLLVLEMLTTNFDPLTRLKISDFHVPQGNNCNNHTIEPWRRCDRGGLRWVGWVVKMSLPPWAEKPRASRCYAPTRTMWRCNWSCPMHGWPDRMPKYKENKGAGTVKGKCEWGVRFIWQVLSVVSKIWSQLSIGHAIVQVIAQLEPPTAGWLAFGQCQCKNPRRGLPCNGHGEWIHVNSLQRVDYLDGSLHASMPFQTSGFVLKKAKTESKVSQFLTVIVVKETPSTGPDLADVEVCKFPGQTLGCGGSDVIQLPTCAFKSWRRGLV